MIAASYQLVVLGVVNEFITDILTTFKKKVQELGLDPNMVSYLTSANFKQYNAKAPTVCLYFGDVKELQSNSNELQTLIQDCAFILPIVRDLESFSANMPKDLSNTNGFELKDRSRIEALVSVALEGLSLLRTTRRLFISYRRIESRSVAIQLYEHLDACGFDVFLDTHSIRPGEPFQDELWHRLVDTDVVVLLNTPGFLESEWTQEELTKASAMSVAILQLIWPKQSPGAGAALCFPKYLETTDFEKENFNSPTAALTDNSLKNIASQVESLRARSLASRQGNIINEFMASTVKNGIEATLQPEKFITIKRKDGKEIAVIPTVGVPHAFTYNQTDELIKRIREKNTPEAWLVYDHRNIREKWQIHLHWLDLYLPIKTVKITEIDEWLNNTSL
jgi:hypothetical protein